MKTDMTLFEDCQIRRIYDEKAESWSKHDIKQDEEIATANYSGLLEFKKISYNGSKPTSLG